MRADRCLKLIAIAADMAKQQEHGQCFCLHASSLADHVYMLLSQLFGLCAWSCFAWFQQLRVGSTTKHMNRCVWLDALVGLDFAAQPWLLMRMLRYGRHIRSTKRAWQPCYQSLELGTRSLADVNFSMPLQVWALLASVSLARTQL